MRELVGLGVSSVVHPQGFRVEGAVSGVPTSFLVDTGAAVTLLRRDTWDRISASSPQKLKKWSALNLVSADGSPLTVHGSAWVNVVLGRGVSKHLQVVVVSPLTSEAILGLDSLISLKAQLDLSNQQMQIEDQQVIPLCGSTVTQAREREVCHIRVESTTRIPPRCEFDVLARFETPISSGNWLLEEPKDKSIPVVVAHALVKAESPLLRVRVLNTSEKEVTVYTNSRIAVAEQVEVMDSSVSTVKVQQVDMKKEEMLKELAQASKLELDNAEQNMFFQLLQQYEDIFAATPTELGCTDKLQHRINTGGCKPIRQPVRRIPQHQREEVRSLLKDMLQKEVIEPSSSPWASPIVLVKKKDGSTRFCVDYRKLNEATLKDAYPLPRIDETLDTLAGSCWFSTIDLVSGYWQVEVDEVDRPKTAFCTLDGLYQFRVMPFGLCNAPATFQRLMDLVLSGLQWSHCLVYLDDVIILGTSFYDHLSKLAVVFERLRRAGLKLKTSKCAFFQRKVKYLGHIISREGVATDPQKTAKVKIWPTPTSTKEVQQFLGFASYYRRFIKYFADIARPLYRLTERGAAFRWSPECQCAFDLLRKRLTTAPILAYPKFKQPFLLDTDASNSGIGAVLSQIDDEGQEHVVAYGSRLLTKTERNYCVTRRELLAVVVFTAYFRPYLLGRHFQLRTDHGSLSWLCNFKNPEGQLARWLEKLQEYDFEIVHRQGKLHTNADALSRIPCNQCGRSDETSATVASTVITSPTSQACNSLRDAQLADTELGPLLRAKEAGRQLSAEDSKAMSRAARRLHQLYDQLTIHNGVLYRQYLIPEVSKVIMQQLIPLSLRPQILQELHEGVTGGHLGTDKTLAKLKERFYWPGHYNDVKNWCRNCHSCAQRKSPSPKYRAALQSVKTGYPL